MELYRQNHKISVRNTDISQKKYWISWRNFPLFLPVVFFFSIPALLIKLNTNGNYWTLPLTFHIRTVLLVTVNMTFTQRIRIVYWWNAKMTITHQYLCIRIVYWWNVRLTIIHQDQIDQSLALIWEMNLATPSSAPSAEGIREPRSVFQSLMVWGEKLHL